VRELWSQDNPCLAQGLGHACICCASCEVCKARDQVVKIGRSHKALLVPLKCCKQRLRYSCKPIPIVGVVQIPQILVVCQHLTLETGSSTVPINTTLIIFCLHCFNSRNYPTFFIRTRQSTITAAQLTPSQHLHPNSSISS
jgi:hypothetical protein